MKLMDDSIPKVKAHAIQSLGLIGLTSLMLTDKLLWSVRFEKDPTVRAEACHTLRTIKPEDDRLIPYLKDLLLTDTDPTVRNEAAMALDAIGDCPTADNDIGHQVRSEVKKLGTVSAITRSILAAEAQEKIDRHRRRLLGRTKSERKEDQDEKDLRNLERLENLIEDERESTADTELLELAQAEENGKEGELMSDNEDFSMRGLTGSECLAIGKHSNVSFDLNEDVDVSCTGDSTDEC
jgi:HEAT repeat protein